MELSPKVEYIWPNICELARYLTFCRLKHVSPYLTKNFTAAWEQVLALFIKMCDSHRLKHVWKNCLYFATYWHLGQSNYEMTHSEISNALQEFRK